MKKSNYSFNLMAIAMILSLPSCMWSKKNNEEMNQQTSNDKAQKTMIKLFVYSSCPYCHKVITALRASKNLDKVLIVDAGIAANLAELKSLSNNNTQCPFLYDVEKNVKMPESDDIIQYLSTRFS